MAEHLLSEKLAVVACIDPDAYGSGTTLSDAIDMAMHRNVMFIVMNGTMVPGSGTLDFKVKESTASGGTYTKISGKSITQMTEASSGDDDTQAIINVDVSELTAGYRYIKGSLILTTKGSDCGVVALAGNSRYTDAVTSTSFGDLSSVAEIVA